MKNLLKWYPIISSRYTDITGTNTETQGLINLYLIYSNCIMFELLEDEQYKIGRLLWQCGTKNKFSKDFLNKYHLMEWILVYLFICNDRSGNWRSNIVLYLDVLFVSYICGKITIFIFFPIDQGYLLGSYVIWMFCAKLKLT